MTKVQPFIFYCPESLNNMKKYLNVLIVGLLLSGLIIYTVNQISQLEIVEANSGISPNPSTFTIDVPIYYMNGDALLEPEVKTLAVSGNKIVEAVFDALMLKPDNERIFSVLDDSVKILSYEIVNQKLYLNLSEELLYLPFWQRGYQQTVLYSIVNSLCQIDTINRVQIKVAGVDVNAYVDEEQQLSDLSFNESMIYHLPETPEEVVVNFLNLVKLQRYELAYQMLDNQQSIGYERFSEQMARHTKIREAYAIAQPFSIVNEDQITVVINYQYDDHVRNITYDGGTESWHLTYDETDGYKIIWVDHEDNL